MGVRLIGLERARLIPGEFKEAMVVFKRELAVVLVEDFRSTEPRGGTWPKGRRKTIQDQTKAFIRGDNITVGTFHSRYARALDVGHTVRPKPGAVMRFRNQEGDFVFTRKPITHKPRPYFGRVLVQVPRLVTAVYDAVFGEIGKI